MSKGIPLMDRRGTFYWKHSLLTAAFALAPNWIAFTDNRTFSEKGWLANQQSPVECEFTEPGEPGESANHVCNADDDSGIFSAGFEAAKSSERYSYRSLHFPQLKSYYLGLLDRAPPVKKREPCTRLLYEAAEQKLPQISEAQEHCAVGASATR